MPRSITQGFNDFHDKIKTSKAETSTAKSHRSAIKLCLENKVGLDRFTRIGSFGNGTNINGYSDVDYLACLPTSSLTATSTASLVKVKNALDARFPNTGISINTPAVVCPFGTVYKSEDTEIVVANYIKEKDGFKLYEIADGNNGWMEVSPDAHNQYVTNVDKKHGGKVKPLIRFLKSWKYFRDVPIDSFYLEMRVAKYADTALSIVYSMDVKSILTMLSNDKLSAMQDPMGATGYIYPCKTEAFREDALSKLKTAAARAQNAFEAESNGDTKTAFDWWRLLYNDKFPTYYP